MCIGWLIANPLAGAVDLARLVLGPTHQHNLEVS
jgi:hypothetical protein